MTARALVLVVACWALGSVIGVYAGHRLVIARRCVPGECLGLNGDAFVYCPDDGWRP
jgi:hypothetical protein